MNFEDFSVMLAVQKATMSLPVLQSRRGGVLRWLGKQQTRPPKGATSYSNL